jgi:hypothetical protein
VLKSEVTKRGQGSAVEGVEEAAEELAHQLQLRSRVTRPIQPRKVQMRRKPLLMQQKRKLDLEDPQVEEAVSHEVSRVNVKKLSTRLRK